MDLELAIAVAHVNPILAGVASSADTRWTTKIASRRFHFHELLPGTEARDVFTCTPPQLARFAGDRGAHRLRWWCDEGGNPSDGLLTIAGAPHERPVVRAWIRSFAVEGDRTFDPAGMPLRVTPHRRLDPPSPAFPSLDAAARQLADACASAETFLRAIPEVAKFALPLRRARSAIDRWFPALADRLLGRSLVLPSRGYPGQARRLAAASERVLAVNIFDDRMWDHLGSDTPEPVRRLRAAVVTSLLAAVDSFDPRS